MDNILDDILKNISERAPHTPFSVEFWDETKKQYGRGTEKFKIIFRCESALKKFLSAGTLGFGEEYMAGNIEVAGDMQAMLGLYDHWRDLNRNISPGVKFRVLANAILTRATVRNSKKNIRHHYDIGNDFYSLWLDSAMAYSCAYFKNGSDSLEIAQANKYDHICKKLRLRAGEKLLDIGCGWGGMMFHAAKNYGADCTGCTLSETQYRYVNEKIEKEGLGGKIKIFLKDYRRVEGVFDKSVSVGMFEHVGKNYYSEFFSMVKRTLKPSGIGVLHTIGSRSGGATDPFIAKYIFPGGFVPTLAMVADAMNKAELVFYDVEDLRMHYAKTLDLWIANFEAAGAEVKNVLAREIKDRTRAEEFIRMWRLYLNGSAVAFKNAGNRLYQITFTNGVNNNLPLTRDYLYS
ncbi:MAG: cyclopropane-fatty-acyl-phospholipid synthase family protein [Minisyncoccales bacterium]